MSMFVVRMLYVRYTSFNTVMVPINRVYLDVSMVPSARLGKEGGARNGARETAIYATTRVKLETPDLKAKLNFRPESHNTRCPRLPNATRMAHAHSGSLTSL